MTSGPLLHRSPIRYNAPMDYSTIFFDLDATLYPPSSGLLEEINQRIQRYLVDHLNFPRGQADALREEYFLRYGTTLAGLHRHHRVDPEDYQEYVHDLDLADFLQADPVLRSILEGLEQRLWIFTNASSGYARKVLQHLGVERYFQGIIDSRAVGHVPKPDPSAYRKALQIAGEGDPSRCILVDDRIENLIPAGKLGMFTVHVHPEKSSRQADLGLARIHDLLHGMPELRLSAPGTG